MTQEEKQLLLIDLCARLPYGVMCKLSAKDVDVQITEKLELGGLEHFISGTMNVKPYLRPMSSMTDEERKEEPAGTSLDGFMYPDEADKYINWLNEHHFDYCGLIEKGLAIEAPEGMYKTE